jgi:hypothetical protein
MRFFTDDFFSEQQKAALAGSEYLKSGQPLLYESATPSRLAPNARQHAVSSDECRAPAGEEKLQSFERNSKSVELIFLGVILVFYVAAALLDMLGRSHVLGA